MTAAASPGSVRAATEPGGAPLAPRKGRLRRGQRSLWIMALLALVALGAVFSYLVYREYESTLARERERLLTHARVVDENLGQQLLGANAALTNVSNDVAALIARGQESQIVYRLKALDDAMPLVRTMLVSDASGTVVAASRAELIGADVSERAYFQLAKAEPARDRLYLSEPFKTRLNVFSVNLVKIWTDDKGQFGGGVTATLDPEYLQVLLRSVLYADETSSMLIHGNGQVFVSVPAIDTVKEPGPAAVDAFFTRHRDAGHRESIFAGTTSAVGDQRIAAYRSTQPAGLKMDQPLVAVISRPVAAVLAPWRAVARLYGLMYCLLAATVLVGAWLEHNKREALMKLRVIRDRESREHSERLNLALEGGDLGLWDIDLASGIRTVNNRVRAMVGHGPGEPAESISEWAGRVHPDDLGPWQAARQGHAAGATESLVVDYRVRHRDGHWVWLHSRGRVTQRDAQGRALRMTGTDLDVTERQAAEARIKHAGELLARMSRVSRTGGWEHDLKTGRSSWSPEMYRIRELDPLVVLDQQIVMEAFLPESRLLLAAARAAASKVAQTCLDAIRDAQIVHATSSVGPWLSVSLGVASVEVNAARPALSLIERADAALYRAKHLGRGRYETLGSAAAV